MDSNKIIDLYVISHRPYKKVETDIFTPIYTTRAVSPNDASALASDEGDNIAGENSLYAEFTTYYWAWKNRPKPDYIGFFQYRRFISFKDNVTGTNNFDEIIQKYGFDRNGLENVLEDCDVLLPTSLNFKRFCNKNMLEQYNMWHKSSYMNMAMRIIKEKYPSYEKDCFTALLSTDTYYINLFIMTGDLFDSYMTWIMDIFDEIKKRIAVDYSEKDFAYLGERLFNIFLVHKQRTENIKVKVKQPVYIRRLTPENIEVWIGDEVHIPAGGFQEYFN